MNYTTKKQFWTTALMVCVVGGMLYLCGAGDVLAQAAGGTPRAGSESQTFWQLFRQGGFMMWVMLVVSIFAMSLIIESALKLRLNLVSPPEVFNQLKTLIAQGNYQEAWRVANAQPSPLSRVVAAGLQRLGRGEETVNTALEEFALKEALMMKTKVNYLSVIGVVSPMLGLIGTVVGMIEAFQQIGTGAGLSNPSLLAASIGKVLVATAFGLFIAVPAFFSYYFFRNRAQAMIVALQDNVTHLMENLPYTELHGVKIGEELESELGPAPAPLAGPAASPTAAVVAAAPAVTPAAVAQVACPNCNNPIAQGANPCPSCGAQIQWS